MVLRSSQKHHVAMPNFFQWFLYNRRAHTINMCIINLTHNVNIVVPLSGHLPKSLAIGTFLRPAKRKTLRFLQRNGCEPAQPPWSLRLRDASLVLLSVLGLDDAPSIEVAERRRGLSMKRREREAAAVEVRVPSLTLAISMRRFSDRQFPCSI